MASNGVKNRTLAEILTTSHQDVYTVPDHFLSKVWSIIISNKTDSPKTFSLEWYDSNASPVVYYAIAGDVEMKKNSIIQIDDVMYLQSGNKIRAKASDASAVTVSVSVEETFRLSEI